MMDYFYLGDYDLATTLERDRVTPWPDDGAVQSVAGDHTADSLGQPTDPDDPWGSWVPKKKKKKVVINFGSEPGPEPEPEPEAPIPASTSRDAHPLELHAKVFAMASKYDVESLELTARKKFKDQLRRQWYVGDMITAMDVVFNHTPDREIKLRDALKDAIVMYATDVVRDPGFEAAVAGIDGLAYDLFCRMSRRHG